MRPSNLLIANFILSIIFLILLIYVETSGYQLNILDYIVLLIVCMCCGFVLFNAFSDSDSAGQMFLYPMAHLTGTIGVIKVLDIFQAEGGFWGNVVLAAIYGMITLAFTPSGPEGGYHPRPSLAVVSSKKRVRWTEVRFSYGEGDYIAIGVPFFGVFIGVIKGILQIREINKRLD